MFDVDSIGLTRCGGHGHGIDAAGRETGVPIGSALGGRWSIRAPVDIEREIERFRRKLEAGAEFAMTQPVYDAKLLESVP